MSEEKEIFSKESLAKSVETIGELYPVIVNQDGKILDGDHRKEENPQWHTKTVPTKDRIDEITVRLHAHHRRRIPREETQALLIEMAQELSKKGIPKEQITAEVCKCSPYSDAYVRELLPLDFKQPVKVQAARLTEHTRSILDDLVECSYCHQAVLITKAETINGKSYCPSCADKVSHKKPKPPEKPPQKLYTETWVHRKATMETPVSKFELAFDAEAERQELPPYESQKLICVQHTKVDKAWTLPNGNLLVYLDGPVHEGQEDRDTAIRDKLRQWGDDVLEIPHSGGAVVKEVQDAVEKVRRKLVQKGWKPPTEM